MKQISREIKDENDEKIIVLLASCGCSSNEAKCLCYLLTHEKGMSSDIETTMDMRQPEVSTGLRDLLKKGFVSYTKIPMKRKGRPRQDYAIRSKATIHSKLKSELLDVVSNANDQLKEIDGIFLALK
jgi:predicted transcriptional regulator